MGREANGRLLNTLAIVCVGLVIILDVALLGSSGLQALGIKVT